MFNRTVRLTKKVVYVGKDLFGRQSSLIFRPIEGNGWCWRPRGSRLSIPIEPNLATTCGRWIELASRHGDVVRIWEHIQMFRLLFGLVGVEVEVGGWPPYGRALDLDIWRMLEPVCVEVPSFSIPHYTVMEAVRVEYPNLRGGQLGFTKISPPTNEGCLTVTIRSVFGEWGQDTRVFSSRDGDVSYEEICMARPLGQPSWLYHISKLLSRFGWLHHHEMAWPQELDRERLLRELTDHRFVDLLGALGLLCRDGLFLGDVECQCAGHWSDLGAVLRASKVLTRL